MPSNFPPNSDRAVGHYSDDNNKYATDKARNWRNSICRNYLVSNAGLQAAVGGIRDIVQIFSQMIEVRC